MATNGTIETEAPCVDVITPTLGRPSLETAISSALAQPETARVILVDDSREGLSRSPSDSRVCALRTGGRTGAANARNAGMAASSAPYVAFLDDDDVWLPGHLADAVSELRRRPRVSIYCSRGLVVGTGRPGRIEPVELLGERALGDYFYGPDSWRSRCRRVLTSSIVFTADLRDHPMDPDLAMSEDTWWLLTAQRERGARIHQSEHIGLLMRADEGRESARLGERDIVAWAHRLEGIHRGAGPGYLIGDLGRSAARAGRAAEVRALAKPLLDLPGGRRWLPKLATEYVASALLGARARLRG